MNLIRAIIIFPTLLLCTIISCRFVEKKSYEYDFNEVDCVVKEEIKKGSFPGAVVLIGKADDILYWRAFGDQVIEPFRKPMNKDTVFDLASLTKPIATATSIMILNDRKKIELDDFAGTYLPAFPCHGKEEVRIRHLLTHTSGLPAYTNASKLKELFGSPCPDKLIEKICSLKALSKPGEEFRYSCLGYIVLAKIVELSLGERYSRHTDCRRAIASRHGPRPPGKTNGRDIR